MAHADWRIKGLSLSTCNCDYGCPCQFNGRPSSPDGSCRYATFTQIDQGHYGEVKLDGLSFAFVGAVLRPIDSSRFGSRSFSLLCVVAILRYSPS